MNRCCALRRLPRLGACVWASSRETTAWPITSKPMKACCTNCRGWQRMLGLAGRPKPCNSRINQSIKKHVLRRLPRWAANARTSNDIINQSINKHVWAVGGGQRVPGPVPGRSEPCNNLINQLTDTCCAGCHGWQRMLGLAVTESINQ